MKNRYKILLLALLVGFSGFTTAQEATSNRVYLFDTFKPSTVKMKNGSRAETAFNYDGNKQEMVYYVNDQLMILDGIEKIDTIYIEKRVFIPFRKNFREIIRLSSGELQIDWKIKRLYLGKKGAYGMITHTGTVEKVNPGSLTGYLSNQPSDNQSNQIYETVFKNEYYLLREGKPMKFTSLKSLLKLFSENNHSSIEAYTKDQKINMDIPEDVIKVAEYCINLK